MKRNCHTSVRVLSALLPLSMIAADIVTGWEPSIWNSIFAGMTAGSVILYATPRCRDDNSFAFRSALVAFLAIISGKLILKDTDVTLIMSMVFALFLVVAFTIRKYRHICTLFKTDSPWNSINDYSWMLYGILLLTEVALHSGFFVRYGIEAVTSVLSAVLYFVLYQKAYSGRTLMLTYKKENEVKEIIHGNLRPYITDNPEEGVRMNALYKKVQEYMDTHKPFLKDGFGIADLAEEMYTNRSYLSRAINLYSGRNFCQFINYYRIKYAVSVLDKDLNYKIIELSTMCGFHTVVSFNMAFKLFMDETPGEYISRKKVSRL